MRRLLLAWCLAGVPAALARPSALPLRAVISVDASTGRPADEGPYPARQAADADPKTTWVANGRRLLLGFPAAAVVGVELLPGYAKSAALWSANRRVLALRYRFYPRPGAGQGSAPSTEWKTVKVPAPERFTTAAAAMVSLELTSPGEVVALELEVTEATAPTKSEDICVSQVRVLASGAPACPKAERWRYLESVPGTTLEVGDRLAADFDAFDLDACTAQHEGTGVGLKTFKGTCRTVPGGVRLEGATTFFDGEQEQPPRPYAKTLGVTRFGCALALIDGHAYWR